MDINTLGIIQDELRNVKQIGAMVRGVREGKVFDAWTLSAWKMPEPVVPRHDLLMELAHFPDGEYYIHNGHHRAVAIFLAGRDHLLPEEYYVKEWEYSDYNDIVFLNPDDTWRGYVTPFDVKTETRIADFGPHKDNVYSMYYSKYDVPVDNDERIREYILSPLGVSQYKREKRRFSVEELALSIVNSALDSIVTST